MANTESEGCQTEAAVLNNKTADPTPAELKEECIVLLEKSTYPEERLALQRMLVEITVCINPDDVEGLYGIQIHERNETRPFGEGCTEYTIGHGVDVQAFHDHMRADFRKSKDPVPGAYALYLKYGFIPSHIGRVTENGTIISKWSPRGHAYEHAPFMAPYSYGTIIEYYFPQ